MERSRELAMLGLLACLWGSSYLLIGLAVATIGPVTVVATRVAVAALALIAFARWRGHRFPRDRATWGALAVQSFLNSFGAWTLLAWGQRHVETGLAGVLNSSSPVFVVLITLLVLRRRVAARAVAGAVLGLAGVAVILGPEVLGGLGAQALAQCAVLGSAILYALAALNGHRFAALAPAVTAAGTMIVASAVLIPASLVFERPWTFSPSALSLGAALLLGLFCTALALLLYFRLVVTLGPVGVASQSYLRAGIAVLLGIVLMAEMPAPSVALGIAVALAGVLMINWPARRPAPRPIPPGPPDRDRRRA